MKKITIEYESMSDLKYDENLKNKGRAFEEFNNYLRSVNKYDVDIDLYVESLNKANSQPDAVYIIIDMLRTKLNELLKEQE